MSGILSSVSQWFLRPTQDLKVLHRRQEVIHFFTSPRNSDPLRTLQSSLRNIRNIPVTSLPFEHLHLQIWQPPKCSVRLCLCAVDSSEADDSFSHQSDWLAESLQGWSHRTVFLNTPFPCDMFLLNVDPSVCLSDSVQCSVYQGHGASPASVHSTVSWYQRRVFWWSRLYHLPHQQSCEFLHKITPIVLITFSNFVRC